MTIQAFLKTNPSNEATDILAHLLKRDKTQVMLSDAKIPQNIVAKANAMLKEYKSGKPLAYILGYKYFYGLKFKVNKHVLIPRPETEWLVDRSHLILTAVRIRRTTKILDMGTGSGCIAISLAHSKREVGGSILKVTASDISQSALTVAKANAKTNRVRVEFILSDLFSNISGKYDIVIANLPYVPQGMYELLFHNLKYEPKVAITDGGEVWDIYHRFFTELPKHLKPGGTALLEMDDGAKPAMQKMIKKLLPHFKTTFHKDLGGLWRYIELQS